MTGSACPYLVCEKTAIRQSLIVREEAPMTITVTWYCRHPFHGIAVELGDDPGDVDSLCSACSLPCEHPCGSSG
jgi:hypothetical protein